MRKGQIKEREKLFTRYVHIQIKVVLSLHQFWAQGVKTKNNANIHYHLH